MIPEDHPSRCPICHGIHHLTCPTIPLPPVTEEERKADYAQWLAFLSRLGIVAYLFLLPLTSLGSASVTLGWNANYDWNLTGYKLYWSLESQEYEASVPVTGTQDTLNFLTVGTTYYFVVTAVNTDGESGYSNEVSYTPAQNDTLAAQIADFKVAGTAVSFTVTEATGNIPGPVDVAYSNDLKTWVVLLHINDPTEPTLVTDTATGHRFYRLQSSP